MSSTTAPHTTSTIPPPGLTNPSRRTIDLTGLKERMTFTKYASETNNTLTEFQSVVSPGHANPEHYMPHAKATMTSRKGTVSGTLDGKKFALRPGETLMINVGQRYSIKNETAEDAEMTVVMEPGVEGFEQAMYVMHGLARDGKSGADGMPRDFVQLAVVVGLMDVTLTGWGFWFARPAMAFARGYAWVRGVEGELLEKYWKV